MKLTCYPYQLQFKHPFKIAHGLRTHTPVVFVKLEHDGCKAWGEATLPPYLPETQQTVVAFLQLFSAGLQGAEPESWAAKLEETAGGNYAARAALDMALWQLQAQLQQTPLTTLLGVSPQQFPLCTYTIGVSDPYGMQQKIEEAMAAGFALFKLKLNGENDALKVEQFRSLSTLPFAVDMNQGWANRVEVVEFINTTLQQHGCLLVEQPLHKDALGLMKQVKTQAQLPLYADESCQTLEDVERMRDCFDGINVKLMKCGGLTNALRMIRRARELGLKVLVGCMSESSVGCSAAAALTPLADYADLDGPYLIANDPFTGMKVEEGRIKLHPLRQALELTTGY